MVADAGTVIIQAAPIEYAKFLLTNFLLALEVDDEFLSGLVMYQDNQGKRFIH